jgi:Domain of unknown function (DUF4392)
MQRSSNNKGLPVVAAGLVLAAGSAWAAMRLRQARRTSVKHLMSALLACVQNDAASRGIRSFCSATAGDLLGAAQALIGSGRIVAIMTGFPCNMQHTPPTETDGPAGALCLAKACIALGKRVIMLTDECNAEVLMSAVAGAGLAGSQLSLEAFPPAHEWSDADEERLLEVAVAADAVIACERPGAAADGCYYTMRGLDMGQLVAPIDRLVELVSTKQTKVPTIAVGDGGNEVCSITQLSNF